MRFSDGQLVLILITVALSGAVIGGIVLLVRALRTRCPGCRRSTIELDLRDNPGGVVWGSPGARMFRCSSCGDEYRRADHGPLIPKHAWEAGARDEIPRARVHK